jgi:hypothetical protein
MALTKVPGNLLNANLADLANVSSTSPSTNQVLKWNGSAWAPAADSAGTGGIGSLVADTSPQLGGTLDANSNTIDMGTNVITDTKVGQWDTAYSWGNHASSGYATLSSPTLTGTPLAPTASASTNTTQIATTAFVGTAVSNLVDSSPSALNTLNELAAALGDDANFSTTVTNSIATKLPLAGGTLTGALTLGGNLNIGSHDIVTSSNGTIDLDPNGSGKVVFKGNSTRGAGQFVLNCENNSHGITIKGPPHSAGASYTLTLPNDDGSSNQVLKTDGSGNLSWTTITSGTGGIGSSTTTQIITLSSANKVGIGQNVGNALALLHLYQASGSGDLFKIQTGAGGKLLMNSSGNLGIGTDSPSQLLDVNGTVELNNLTVGGSQGSDGQVLTSTGSGVAWENAGGAYNDFAIKTGNYTAVSKDQLIVNSGSAVTITLPASPSAGNVVFIKNAGTGTVTVARNGSKINSTADNGELIADAGATLVYVDSTIGWKEL